jgi:hypothetical protein
MFVLPGQQSRFFEQVVDGRGRNVGHKPLQLPHTMCHTYFIETFGAGCNSRPAVE